MICAVVTGPTYALVKKQLEKVSEETDFVEMRLDKLLGVSLSELELLKNEFPKIRMLFTMRPKRQGGSFDRDENLRLEKLKEFLTLAPDWVDLESDIALDICQNIKKSFPKTKILLSCHLREFDLVELNRLIDNLKKREADAYKIALPVSTTSEALYLLNTLKVQSKDTFILIGMGKEGSLTRILSRKFGSPWTYAAISEEEKVDDGQLTVSELKKIYRYNTHTEKTALYGLIGDPVEMSIGHIFHNEYYQKLGHDALYVKIRVSKEELDEVFESINTLGFNGLSVTMPLKNAVLEKLESVHIFAKKVGAVNTVFLKDNKWIGINTDGPGALKAIGEVTEKKILILGAGGAASAIAFALKEAGADVYITNRTEEKAKLLANKIDATYLAESKAIEKPFDLVVNTIPPGVDFDYAPYFIHPPKAAMDITTRPKQTRFLSHAQKASCEIIYGESLYFHQAMGQIKTWFHGASLESGLPYFINDCLTR